MNRHSGRITRSLFTTKAREGSALCSLQFVASVLVLVGFFGPWVAHRTAGLTVTGYELSEFAKFFPQVQGGAVPVKRALFITPLLAGTISLALVLHHSSGHRLLWLIATGLTILIELAALPPHDAILEPQYRLQLSMVVVGLLGILTTPLARRLSERIRGALFALLACAGLLPALWQAFLLRPLVVELYRQPVRPGWGLVVCAIGSVLLAVAGLRRLA